ncbi:MAG: nuclear transport factor 2 family protein [Burkholderiales bacterium]|jgi:hypothetical protein|nr:nuclear transport factor 2 family protein [Burkholderiales bacterium]
MSIADRSAIEATIQTYFDGLYEGDTVKLASVFHPTSSLTWDQDDKLMVISRDAWLQAVRDRPSSKSRELARDDAILLIDQSGPTTAFVKVKCQIPPRYFTDYLSLIKVEGRWQIVQKIYAFEVRN